MSLDATTSSGYLGMAGVSGVGCTACTAAIVPTMTVGVYMYYSDADGQYYVDTSIAFTGSIDFTFEFGLVDPTIDIDTATTAPLYEGTAVTISYPAATSIVTLTLTPKVDMTVGSGSSVVATGTLAVAAAANTDVTSTTTYKGSDNTLTPTVSQSSDISMPTLTATSFDVTSGGSDVEITVTPYINIDLTLGPSVGVAPAAATFDIVSMTTKVAFPTKTTMNMADSSSCVVTFDVGVGAGLTSITALKDTIVLVGDSGICGEAPDDATATLLNLDSETYEGCSGTPEKSSGGSDDDDVCFSADSTVQLASGATKTMADLEVGDSILSADAAGKLSYSEVAVLPHGANSKTASFVKVTTESGKAVEATPSHLLMACDGSLVEAKSASCLRTVNGAEAVASIESFKANGIYTAVTQNNEFIVVDGVVASPFAVVHGLINQYYMIHRAVYAAFPSLMKLPVVTSANLFVGMATAFAVNALSVSQK
jgi:hypothetical protein